MRDARTGDNIGYLTFGKKFSLKTKKKKPFYISSFSTSYKGSST
jgi:hypothetical protein